MAKKKKKSGRGQKVRVEFRRNRAPQARKKDWTELAGNSTRAEEFDPDSSERVVAKGGLSRKRTIVIDDDGERAQAKETRPGVVVRMFGLIAHVDDGQNVWPCTVRRVLRTLRINERSAVTVGDRVRFSITEERKGIEQAGVVEHVEPRTSELKRSAGRREHAVAANIDNVVIVSSADMPKPRPNLVDRYIVSALHGRMKPIICMNKIDLADADEVDAFLKIYRDIGHETLAVSAESGRGIEQLRALLANHSTVFAGQSGVGKSSLLNAVQPGLKLKVGAVSEDSTKGRHTTSLASLLKLDGGGYVVDTPGVRSFDLSCVPRELLESYFVDFAKLVPDCKYPDCTHIHESECAVKSAVEAGELSIARYESYVRLFTDPEFRGNATF